VQYGSLVCSKNGEFIKKYSAGETFGELALLYNAPRAASIKAETDCSLYALDRETFNQIVKGATVRKREKYETFLPTVELLQSLTHEERTKFADVLRPQKF